MADDDGIAKVRQFMAHSQTVTAPANILCLGFNGASNQIGPSKCGRETAAANALVKDKSDGKNGKKFDGKCGNGE